MALDGKRKVVGRHAGAVIDDADQFAPAGRDGDGDRARAGVDRVLDEFLHGRSRPLDHLTGGDSVDEDGIETADGHAGSGKGEMARRRIVSVP